MSSSARRQFASTIPVPVLGAGDVVGSYRLEEALADGGMGVVYQATHVVLQRRAAVKVLRAGMVGHPAARERVLQEARILESIEHPAVAAVYDAGVLEDGRPWVAMELVEGETLAEHLARRGRLPVREVVAIALEIAEALGVAHRTGVVHRDIKPDNVMLSAATSGLRVKVLDWGIAHVARSGPRLTEGDLTQGTPHYMAPEQIRGEPIDGRADVYALGAVAYELVTGAPPFLGTNPIEIIFQHLTCAPRAPSSRAPVPAALDALILAMLAKDAAARPSLALVCASLAALLDAGDLERAGGLARGTPPARPAPPPILADDDAIIAAIERCLDDVEAAAPAHPAPEVPPCGRSSSS